MSCWTSKTHLGGCESLRMTAEALARVEELRPGAASLPILFLIFRKNNSEILFLTRLTPRRP
jgi:hypothetical protein